MIGERLQDEGGRLMMERDEIEDSVCLFLEDDARLTDESCYFVCKRLMEYYWDRINEEDDVGDDDEFDGENDGEGSEFGQDDDVDDRRGHKEASEEDVEEGVDEEEGGEKVE